VLPRGLRRGQVTFRSHNSCLSLGVFSPGRRRACVLFGVSFRGGYSPTGLPGDTAWLAFPPTGWGRLGVLSQPAERVVAVAGGGRRGGDGGGGRCASGGGGACGGRVPNECPKSLRSAPRSRARPLPRQHVKHAPGRRVKAGDELAGFPPLTATPNHRRPRRERVSIRRSNHTRSVGRRQARIRARRCRAPPLPLPPRPPVGCGGGQPVGCSAEAADEHCRRRCGKRPRPSPRQRPRGRPGAGRMAEMADHLRRGGERQGGRDRPTVQRFSAPPLWFVVQPK